MRSSFSAFRGTNKTCRCGRSVPKHVTPDTCYHCKNRKEMSSKIHAIEVERERKRMIKMTFVTCRGICLQKVPSHVTPTTCRFCTSLKVCDGLCGKVVLRSTTVETCSNCDMIRFPYVKCEGCDNQVRKTPKCDSCVKKDRENAYMQKLIALYGPIDLDKAIVLRIKGTGYCHTGYSCLTPFEIEDVKIDEIVYFPAFQSAVSEFRSVKMRESTGSIGSADPPTSTDPVTSTDSIDSTDPIDSTGSTDSTESTESIAPSITIRDCTFGTDTFVTANKFLTPQISNCSPSDSTNDDYNSSSEFPSMNYYITGLNLKRIRYSGICNCNGGFNHDDEPRVDTVDVVDMRTCPVKLTSFFFLTTSSIY